MQAIIQLSLGAWLISLGVAKSTETRPCNIGTVNGCSVPPGIRVPFTDQFTTACDRHDVCYACGSDKKLSRRRCDNLFHTYMLKICQVQGQKTDCKKYADLFYNVVQMFGKAHYSMKPNQWCTHSRVPYCLNGAV